MKPKKDYTLVKQKARRFLLGMNFVDGFIYKAVIYILLISFSYIYLYPVLFMLVNSFMSVEDLINPGIKWCQHRSNTRIINERCKYFSFLDRFLEPPNMS